MMTTLRMRVRDRESRRFFGAYLGGKMVGLGVMMLGLWAITWYFSTKAGAAMLGQTTPALKADDVVNPLNTVWVLLAAFMVFFMQAGFMMLEAGFGRTREVSNIMLECIADTCLCGLLFWAFGFAFMFGSGNGWIGHQYFFLNNAPLTYGSTGVSFLAFFLFQFAFADTCSTITTGAMVGRTAFGGDLLYSVAVSGFIYPILGHWVWGPDGWLATMKTPFHDFPGSTLSALDFEGIGRVATNTTLAASAAGLVAIFVAYPRAHKWDTGISINGFLAGLVAITCPCYWVSPFGAICIGAIAGVVVILGIDLLEYLRIDDPIGAWPVHGLCGMWGTWSLGLFATGQHGGATSTGPDPSTAFKGLFYGGGFHQLQFQIFGSLVICACTFSIALIVMYAVKALGVLRLSPEHELE